MMLMVCKAWLRKRWHVYSIGHTEGDYRWLATFHSEEAALKWAGIRK